jgi:DNA-directed DNA polymerase III PolC
MFLNCHTWFSFKYGTLSPEHLFQEAKRHGVKKLILTEINNTCSFVEMLRVCQDNKGEYDLEIAVGVEFRRDNKLLYVLIAKNNLGFQEINRFLSYSNQEEQPFPKRAPEFTDVFCIYAWRAIHPEQLRDNEFIGIRASQLNKFTMDQERRPFRHKYVVHHPVTFKEQLGFKVHQVLRAIDTNVVITKLAPTDQADDDEFMIAPDALETKFRLFPSLVENTKRILDQCTIQFEFATDKNKRHVTGSEESDWEILVTDAWEGFQKRYDVSRPELRERFDKELGVIKKKKFVSYYLIAYDLIRFARKNGIDYVGRGSGANSVIAYCLGITNVDPIELDLYFERFLNEERTTPPDFDLDFSWKDRDTIYQYLFQRYDKNHICLLGSFNTFQGSSIIRELGKVFGLPKAEIDEIADNPHINTKRDRITEQIFAYAQHLQDMPAHLSIHAGGVLITEEPLYSYCATDLPPKNFPVIQMDMYSAEDLGLYKLDVLSQRGLGHIKDTAALVKKTRGIDVDVHRFHDFKKDEKVKDLLRSSKAMGCFYIESPAMRALIAKLQCDDYLTLVAASSIIRPGVARSGMMKAYIQRHHAVKNGKPYEVIHPRMREMMAETYGVMVYQEDVIKVAHLFAGLTLTEADILRRAMSGKYRARKAFDAVREKFFTNCKNFGYEESVTNRVWHEIESFAGYSFAKGHSASYAVESYQSLYLKAYYPLEFMVSVINNFGGFYKTEFYFHEARMLGGKIEAPCVNNSDYLTSLRGDRIYVGFGHIKSLEEKLAGQLISNREHHGPYAGIQDFLHRVKFKLEQVTILIQIGAFRFTGKTKQVLKWEAMLFFSNNKKFTPSGELFLLEEDNFDLPELEATAFDDAFDEMELLGFPLCDPFKLLKSGDRGDAVSATLRGKLGRLVSIVGYAVDIKHTHTRQGQTMHFGAFYDQQGVFFDTVHFPDVATKYPFRGKGFYMIKGKVVDDFGSQIIEVSFMDKMPMVSPKNV